MLCLPSHTPIQRRPKSRYCQRLVLLHRSQQSHASLALAFAIPEKCIPDYLRRPMKTRSNCRVQHGGQMMERFMRQASPGVIHCEMCHLQEADAGAPADVDEADEAQHEERHCQTLQPSLQAPQRPQPLMHDSVCSHSRTMHSPWQRGQVLDDVQVIGGLAVADAGHAASARASCAAQCKARCGDSARGIEC